MPVHESTELDTLHRSTSTSKADVPIHENAEPEAWIPPLPSGKQTCPYTRMPIRKPGFHNFRLVSGHTRTRKCRTGCPPLLHQHIQSGRARTRECRPDYISPNGWPALLSACPLPINKPQASLPSNIRFRRPRCLPASNTARACPRTKNTAPLLPCRPGIHPAL